VVVDRNRISGGGVTAGLDFGLVLLSKLLGEGIARMTQLAPEYDPQPPLHAGTPSEAGTEITRRVREWLGPFDGMMRQVRETASKSMPK
jgi:cyclohexyl-isocyanide hydratase